MYLSGLAVMILLIGIVVVLSLFVYFIPVGL
jgi:hypothetical protein